MGVVVVVVVVFHSVCVCVCVSIRCLCFTASLVDRFCKLVSLMNLVFMLITVTEMAALNNKYMTHNFTVNKK